MPRRKATAITGKEVAVMQINWDRECLVNLSLCSHMVMVGSQCLHPHDDEVSKSNVDVSEIVFKKWIPRPS